MILNAKTWGVSHIANPFPHITQDLLEALASSYEDSGFQQQVAKLCRDTRWRKEDFMRHLPKAFGGRRARGSRPGRVPWTVEPCLEAILGSVG